MQHSYSPWCGRVGERAAGLILDSAFTSIPDAAAHLPGLGWFPTHSLMTQRFDSAARINRVTLTDTHELVRQLPVPWDLVFQDADKNWYLNYWKDLKGEPAAKGCYAADNVLRPGAREVTQFVKAARRDPAFRTSIDDLGSGEGVLLA